MQDPITQSTSPTFGHQPDRSLTSGNASHTFTVEGLAADRHEEWDAYVMASPPATFFHKTAWMRAVRDHYGHEPCYLLARERGRIRGVMPLFLVSGPMTGRALISTPYAVNGGCAADSAAA